MRCAYVRAGRECPKTPTDASLVKLNDQDSIVVLLCAAHKQAYDAIAWAKQKRESG